MINKIRRSYVYIYVYRYRYVYTHMCLTRMGFLLGSLCDSGIDRSNHTLESPSCTLQTSDQRFCSPSTCLQDLSDILESLEKSEAVPALLALILATGNWMNQGTERADAQGFDIEVLERLHSLKGADGRSLQHLLFTVFFDSLNSQAAEFVEALGPLLQNVSRRMVQDAEEAKVSKAVHLTIEECDEAVSSIHEAALDIQAALQKCSESLDPADPVRLRLHREFATATKMIESLVQLRNSVKSKYDRVLQWLHASGWRTGSRLAMPHGSNIKRQ